MSIRTTHVGSLPRPAEMIARTLKKEEIPPSDIRGYVEEVVTRQLELGIDYVNNGELPRRDYVSSTMERISGMGGEAIAPLPRDLEEMPEYSRRFSGRNSLITLNPKAPVSLPACNSEITYTGEASLRDELDQTVDVFAKHNKNLPGSELFFTAPSPGTVALFFQNQFYPGYRSYLERLGEVLATEYQIIADSGAMLQIDCPDLAMGRHTGYKNDTDDEFLETIDTNIGVLNEALANLPADRLRVHVCWGNYPGSHHCDVDLETIYPSILRLRPRFISIESCNHRHSHEVEFIKRSPFPDDKVLLPGVIDTNSQTVEHPEMVALRLIDFADALGPERVIASTDCGFASTASATTVAGEIAWLKLAAMVEGAKRATDRL